MFPGGRGMNPKMLQQMMKQLGIQVEEIEGVERVVIETPTKTYTFTKPSVSAMKAQGQTTYQVQGEPAIAPKGGAVAPADPAQAQPKALYTDEDVKMVMQAAGVSKEKARHALDEAHGEVATAIVALTGG
jgi:nascent polypeptide-associated complex subunit alpha